MVKTLRVVLLVAAAAALAAPAVRADNVVLKADIPFGFVVGERHLPSGHYTFVQNTEYPGVVQIYSSAQKHLAIALCQPVTGSGTGRVELVFHRHGDQRFLKLMRRATGSGYSFPKTQAETVAEAAAPSAITGMQ